MKHVPHILPIIAFALLSAAPGVARSQRVSPQGQLQVSVPLDLPPARGGVPIPVSLEYYGASRVGELGVGWAIATAAVERTTSLAHTRPRFASDRKEPATPIDRVYLTMNGSRLLMVPTGGGSYRPMVGPQTVELQDRGSSGWRLYDGSGNRYEFRRDKRIDDDGLWLLTEVNDASGKNPVRFSYNVEKVQLGEDLVAPELTLASIEYNWHPSGGCGKHRVVFNRRGWDPTASGVETALSLYAANGTLMARSHIVSSVDVLAHGDTCGNASQRVRLRSYRFGYEPDAQTGMPRLVRVDLAGRDGTPQASELVPIARYGWGVLGSSGIANGAPAFRAVQTLAQPAPARRGALFAVHEQSSTLGTTSTYVNRQSLMDMTGDGRPDWIVQRSAGSFAILPSANGASGAIGDPKVTFSSSATTLTGISAISEQRSSYRRNTIFDGANTSDTYVKVIDFNGDGRPDILSVDDPDYWTLLLNTPARALDPSAGANEIRWQERKIKIAGLRRSLIERKLLADSPRVIVPLSRQVSAWNLQYRLCWMPAGDNSVKLCDASTGMQALSVARNSAYRETATAWDLRDVNGDGYPDVVANEYALGSAITGTGLAATCGSDLKPKGGFGFGYGSGYGNNYQTCDVAYGLRFVENGWTPGLPPVAGSSRLITFYNKAGHALYSGIEPFAPVEYLENSRSWCGLEQWRTDSISLVDAQPDLQLDSVTIAEAGGSRDQKTPRYSAMKCGLVDVNGDGLLDRLQYRGEKTIARIGYGTGFAGDIAIPGLRSSWNSRATDCPENTDTSGDTNNAAEFDTTNSGFADVTGDGIPDYVSGKSLRIGTGTSWRDPIDVPGLDGLSRSRASCNGSGDQRTVSMLSDMDGDGRADVISVGDNGVVTIARLQNNASVGAYDAGRIVSVGSGYGAAMRVGYASIKNDIQAVHTGRFAAIVVSSTQVEVNVGGKNETQAPTRYAYGANSQRFDPAADRWLPTPYNRRVVLRGLPMHAVGAASKWLKGKAVIMDVTTSAGDAYANAALRGRPAVISSLDGVLTSDPWKLLTWTTSPELHGQSISTYSTESRSQLSRDCLSSPDFYKTPSLALDIRGRYDRPCEATGIAWTATQQAWRGNSATTSESVWTGSVVEKVDNFGRPLRVLERGDLNDATDDVCVETRYAGSGSNRIYDAVAEQTLTACGHAKGATLARASYAYDEPVAAYGQTTYGRPTSITSYVYETSAGTLQNSSTAKRTYDDWGNLVSTSSTLPRPVDALHPSATRSATTRTTVATSFDGFRLVATSQATSASDVSYVQRSRIDIDPVTLSPLSAVDANGTTVTTRFDGLQRAISSGVIEPGANAEMLLSRTDYVDFAVGTVGARPRVVRQAFPAGNSQAVTTTAFLDPLGRVEHSEQQLGVDYSDVLISGETTYDRLGRPTFIANAHPGSDNPRSPYGTSYHYRTDGSVECAIQAPGPVPLIRTTRADSDIIPRCSERSYVNWKLVDRYMGPNELSTTSPQSGGYTETVRTATGRVLERSRWHNGSRLELTGYDYDRLGSILRIRRYGDPQNKSGLLTWAFARDSLGRAVVMSEPQTASRYSSYDDWGRLQYTSWEVPAGEAAVAYRYDGFNRALSEIELLNGSAIAGSEVTYSYDAGSSEGAGFTNRLGRLASVTGAGMTVRYGYDAFGRANRVSRNIEGHSTFTELYDYRIDGQLSSISFDMPDSDGAETAFYAYDSAGRMTNVSWSDNRGAMELFNAPAGEATPSIDLFGRYRHIVHGNGVEEKLTYRDGGRRELLSTYLKTPLGEERSISYTNYAPDLRVLGKIEAQVHTNGSAEVEQTLYDYDAQYRLTRATTNAVTGAMIRREQYSYDAMGNLRSVDDTVNANDVEITTRQDDPDRVCRTESRPRVQPQPPRYSPVFATRPPSVGAFTVGGWFGIVLPKATRVWLEAESAKLESPMVVGSDNAASLGGYVHVPQGKGNYRGRASYSIDIPETGTYVVWAKLIAPSTRDDSVYITVDGRRYQWSTGTSKRWTWRRARQNTSAAPLKFKLTKGRHSLALSGREDGLKIDRLVVTTDANTNPSSYETKQVAYQVALEAEAGEFVAPFVMDVDGRASEGEYLEVPAEQLAASNPSKAPTATYRFEVPVTGRYTIWGRVLATDATHDSFFVKVDKGVWWTWGTGRRNAWTMRRVTHWNGARTDAVSVWLQAGKTHTVLVAQREPGTKLDKLYLTNQLVDAPDEVVVAAADSCDYRYDATGNVVTIASRQRPSRHFAYDLRQRVTAMTSGATTVKYTYGPEGSVMVMDRSGALDDSLNRLVRHYGPNVRVAPFAKDSSTTQLTERRIPGVGVAIRGYGAASEMVYSHAGRQGMRQVTDGRGAITQEIRYRPYGGMAEDTGAPIGIGSMPAGFGGGEHMTGLGVIHMGARIYDPRIGRFLQRDPLLIPRTTGKMNPYGFAWNDPINFGDPSGLDPAANCLGDECSGGGYDPSQGTADLSPVVHGVKHFFSWLWNGRRIRNNAPNLRQYASFQGRLNVPASITDVRNVTVTPIDAGKPFTIKFGTFFPRSDAARDRADYRYAGYIESVTFSMAGPVSQRTPIYSSRVSGARGWMQRHKISLSPRERVFVEGVAKVAADMIAGIGAEAFGKAVYRRLAKAGEELWLAENLAHAEAMRGAPSGGPGVGAMNRLEYEPVGYHGRVGNTVKSKAPMNGQAGLDGSLQVTNNSPRRIGIDPETREFVIYDRTSDGVFHGHVRTWDELRPVDRTILRKEFDVSKKGKVPAQF